LACEEAASTSWAIGSPRCPMLDFFRGHDDYSRAPTLVPIIDSQENIIDYLRGIIL